MSATECLRNWIRLERLELETVFRNTCKLLGADSSLQSKYENASFRTKKTVNIWWYR